jgi:electron transfer flavoprotein beta subunit
VKIVVCVKQVGSLGDEVEFTDDRRAVDPDYLDPLLNEWDAYATEEALQLRDAAGGEVVVVTCGTDDAEDALRRCLAMGADRALRIDLEPSTDALAPARALARVIATEEADLVLCGAQSADLANAATPAALAGLLGFPCVAVVRKIELEGDARRAVVHRELEAGLVDVLEVYLPAVISVQTGINVPRYAALRAIRQAEEHEIAVHGAGEEGPSSHVRELRHPSHAGSTSMLDGNAAAIAEQISAIVKERVG